MVSVRFDVRWVGTACSWLVVGSLAGCGGSQPSAELVDARRSYDEAAHSDAKELVPDKVLSARQALDRAEAAHEDSAGSFEEKSLAYIAQRQALLAVAQGGIARAQRDLEAADQKYKQTSENMLKRAESSASSSKQALRENQQQLDKVRQQLNSQGDQLSTQAQELKKKEKELEARQKELEGEKTARLEAEKKAAAAMASLAEIARVKEEQRGMVITLDGSVLFASGKATLLPIAENKLGQVAEVLQNQDDSKQITVEGHTDSVGSDENNRRLSQDRADAVRAFLVTKGVPSSRIKSVGRGESVPIGDNKTPDGRAMNRRVEIIVGK
jgi:outer membrane protein OmpA-like peptidoglycan-associated protein